MVIFLSLPSDHCIYNDAPGIEKKEYECGNAGAEPHEEVKHGLPIFQELHRSNG